MSAGQASGPPGSVRPCSGPLCQTASEPRTNPSVLGVLLLERAPPRIFCDVGLSGACPWSVPRCQDVVWVSSPSLTPPPGPPRLPHLAQRSKDNQERDF